MMEEGYVSFETAKLLKEKGFKELCHGYFRKEPHHDPVEQAQAANWNDEPFFVSRPTMQMTMEWLRKKHSIHVECPVCKDGNKPVYLPRYVNLKTFSYGIPCDKEFDIAHPPCKDDYNEACEETIKYCLENLI